MKVLLVSIVIILVVGVYSKESNEDKLMKLPGCEKINDFIGIPLTKCCESLPLIVEKEFYKDCIESCKSKDDFVAKRCCVTDCVLKAAKLVNETGYFDFEASKTALNEKVSNDEKWVEVIKESVETCKAEAPKQLEEWKKKGKLCDTGINMVSSHCIYRQLFFKCPTKTASKECTDLEEFGKKCPIFPVPGRHQKKEDDAAKEE
ncbi:uncharacterized protein [Chironomus tepperi]|uniref:uncharacterized protein n=1 Tax=Chironomus tepperi TaxID=113505 RepID=UPI00391FA88A